MKRSNAFIFGIFTLSLGLAASAFADDSQVIRCKATSQGGRELSILGSVDLSTGYLTVSSVSEDGEETVDEDHVNNNPIKALVERSSGSVSYEIDALSSDNDYGDMFTLILPNGLVEGKSSASMIHESFSRGPVSSVRFSGSCLIK